MSPSSKEKSGRPEATTIEQKLPKSIWGSSGRFKDKTAKSDALFEFLGVTVWFFW